MKNLIITILSIASIFVSCAKVDDLSIKTSSQDKAEITFNTTTAATKAIVDTGFKDGTYFGVYGRVEAGSAVVSAKYAIDNGKYYAGGTNAGKPAEGAYYWPKSDNNSSVKVDFVAIYPYDNTAAIYSRAGDNVTITLDADELTPDSSVDILYAVKHNQNHQVVGTGNNSQPAHYSVPLTFKHALSQIVFEGKYATGNNISSVTVKRIEFLDGSGNPAEIIKDGTIVFDMTSIEASTDVSGGTYAPVVNIGTTKTTSLNFGDNKPLTTSYEALSTAVLVPQAVPAKVRITFDITIQNSTGEAITYTGRQVTKTITSGSDMSDGTAHPYSLTNWVAGHKYIYRYNITAEGIDFTIAIDNWSTPQGWQVWDHDTYAYAEHFFDKALIIPQTQVVMMDPNSLIA